MSVSNHLRHPKTTNEIRQYFNVNMSDFIKVRGKRKPKNLPTNYDDRPKAVRKIETQQQQLQSRKNYRESIRFYSEDRICEEEF